LPAWRRLALSILALVCTGCAAGAGVAAPPSGTVYPAPRTDPGSRLDCSQVPYAGGLQYEYRVHDCWGQYARGSYNFFLGGTDPRDRSQGVLIVIIQTPPAQLVLPARTGDVTITQVRDTLVCFKTPGAGLAGYQVARRRMLPAGEAAAAGCASY
jgi:hypothetical protein